MIFQPGQLELRSAEIDFTGNGREAVEGGLLDFIREISFAEQRAVGAVAFRFLQADATGRVRLRIEIEQQNIFADGCEARRDIHGSGGFSYSALLVGDGNDPGRHGADLRERFH
jgi:hypothetical protein